MPLTPSLLPATPENGENKILIIDDDRPLCRLITEYLRPLGYHVSAVHEGVEGLARATQEPWSAIILDVMLPGLNGFEVLKRLREKCQTPVLMLTARGEESDRIAGLEVGADDYLPKTFSSRELLARLRAVTRRAAALPPNVTPASEAEIIVGDLRINPATRRVVRGDQAVELTALEFDLLASLARSRGRVKSREQLVEAVADRHYDVFDRSVDVHVWSLRKKLGDDPKDPRYIRTFRSVGYMLINPASP